MKKRYRRRNKGNKNIVYLTAFSLLFILSVGYAAFNTNIKITGKGEIKKQTAASQLKSICDAVSGNGLYADEYEENRCVYKGENPNNYINFNDELWRIISVESDGTLKIMKNESVKIMNWDTAASCGVAYNSNSEKSNIKENKDGSITYEIDNIIYLIPELTGGCEKWERPSDTNTYLNGEYYNSLSSTVQVQIQSHSFGIGRTPTASTTSLAQLIASENGEKWTGNIGLASVSDYLRANSNMDSCKTVSLNNTNSDICKTTNWMYDSSVNWWTIIKNYEEFVNIIDIYGDILDRQVRSYSYAIFPTLYLKSDILLSGEGTELEPYQITQL